MQTTRLLRFNRWASHVSSKRTVTEMYDQLVSKGVIEHSDPQRAMAEACTPLLSVINKAHAAGSSTSLPPALLQSARPSTSSRYGEMAWRAMGRLFAKAPGSTVAVSYPENIGVCEKRGLYLWGDVGVGKTMILDLFDLCDVPLTKRRAHLHEFMTDISDRLVRTELVLREERRALRVKNKGKRGGGDSIRPIDLVVREVLAESPILCFDEFQTFDVAHAALLASFFSIAFQQGLFLITTSNRPPEDLCVVSASFSQFLPRLQAHCLVMSTGVIKDYRRQPECERLHAHVFLFPNTKASAARLLQRVERGFPEGVEPVWITDDTLWHYGRCMVIPYHCGGVAVFDFQDICGPRQDLSSADFQVLARHYHTVLIMNVPQVGTTGRNAAHQFVVLVDELYQHGVKLLMTSQVPWDWLMKERPHGTGAEAISGRTVEVGNADLYSEGEDDRSGYTASYAFRNDEEVMSFARIESRLVEMGCRSYLLREHGHYVVSEYNFMALVE